MSAGSNDTVVAQSFTFSVHLRDDARVDASTLDAARVVVARIYQQAGVDVTWADDGAPLTVILRPRASTETARRAKDAMGYTPGGGDERGRIAFVMINRVNEIADGHSAPRPVVLALAIAHELGHLLLSKEHSATGIMKAYFNQADFRKARNGQLIFTGEQGERLRVRALSRNPTGRVTSQPSSSCRATPSPPAIHV